MVWRVGARVHAFVHGLFKPSEDELVRAQYDTLASRFREIGLAEPAKRAEYIRDLARAVATHFTIPRSHAQATLIHDLTKRLSVGGMKIVILMNSYYLLLSLQKK